MTPFLAGAIFGGLFAAAVVTLLFTSLRRQHEVERWDDPFDEPDLAPTPIPTPVNRKLIRERTYSL